MVADSVAINQFTMDSSQSLVVDSASVSEKLCSISKWRDAQILEYARSGVQRDGSAQRSVHCEDPFCRLRGKTSDAVHGHVGRQGFSFDSW